MRNPADLALRWARQWENPDLREARLLNDGAWPASLPVGRPSTNEIACSWQETAGRIRLWRELKIGAVRWETAAYRATGVPVDIPISWEISGPDEWIAAANDPVISTEYKTLRRILHHADPIFHSALIRERSLWKSKTAEETIHVSQLVMQLSPGCAEGRPLRAISLAGIDSKFFQRHRSLILRLLDLRFDGEASQQGLESFLNAWRESDHWLLLVELGAPGPLPFPQIRVRATDLATAGLAAHALLIVENENCFHLLPRDLPGVIAILGAGNNLAWLRSAWTENISIAYWGDLDTWGLTLLARARQYAPNLLPVLMTREIFEGHSTSAVAEKVPASAVAPTELTSDETSLYHDLLNSDHGRLEQEFLPATLVHVAIRSWLAKASSFCQT